MLQMTLVGPVNTARPWNSGNDFPFGTGFSRLSVGERRNMPQNIFASPAFRWFFARKTHNLRHSLALPFGKTIASWYGEERTLARARPLEV